MNITMSVSSAVVCILGLLVFWFSGNPKAQKLAINMFWVGLLVTLMKGGAFLR